MVSPVGAYTDSKGYGYVRKQVANFINNRDGPKVDADWNNIYLTSGASEGVRLMCKMLLRSYRDAMLVPIP